MVAMKRYNAIPIGQATKTIAHFDIGFLTVSPSHLTALGWPNAIIIGGSQQTRKKPTKIAA